MKIGDIFKVRNDNKEQRKVSLENVLIILIVCGVAIPMLTQSIMCNDELQYYYWSRQGFGIAIQHFKQMWIAQGRFLASLFTPIWMWLSVISESTVIFRCISVSVILLNASLFCKVIDLLFEDRTFSKLCFVTLLVFMPISYAPMAPNAYTVCFGIPFSFLLISLIIFLKNISDLKFSNIFLMAICMFIAFSTYEVFVTYVPLYCAIALYKNGIKNIKKVFKDSLWPITIGIIYILLYVLSRIIMPSSYPGNNIEFTVQGAIDILKHLCKASFPGFFLDNPNMRHLNSIINNVRVIDYFRIFVIAIASGILIYMFLTCKNHINNEKQWGVDICVIFVAFLYTFLPALPISISGMYQNNVGPNTGFLALPVTYFTYYAAVFMCCYLVWKICGICPKIFSAILVLVCIYFIQIPVQYTNSNISTEQHYSYERIQKIEDFFETNYIRNMAGAKIYSEDIYKTYYSLGVHDSYWQDTMNILGISIGIERLSEQKELLDNEYILEYNDDFFFIESNESIIIANEYTMEEVVLELENNDLTKVELSNPYYDGGYYIYEVCK